MSKTISGARTTYLATDTITDAWFCRIERTDGVTLGLTSHVEDITLGAVTYLTGAGYTPSATTQRADFKPGTIDIDGLISAGILDRADVIAGVYDHARVFVFVSDYTNPVVDDQKMLAGIWSRVDMRDNTFTAEFRTLTEFANQTIGRTYTPACDAVLGDSRCQVTLDPAEWQASTAYTVRESGDAAVGDVVKPVAQANSFYFKCTVAGTSDSSEPTWDANLGATTTDNTVTWEAIHPYQQTASVADVTDTRNFTSDDLPQPAEWWAYGKVTFTSGNNNGLSMEVKSFGVNSPGGDIELFQGMPYAIASGDTFTISVGCRKRWDEDCIAKFDNEENFQGFPHIPTANTAADFGRN